MVIHHTKNVGNCISMAEVDSLYPQSNVQTSNNIYRQKQGQKEINIRRNKNDTLKNKLWQHKKHSNFTNF